jgi:hypothetical protein
MLILILIICISTITFLIALVGYKYSFAIPKIIALASPFHLLFLILLYHIFSLSATDMNIIASWKELLILFSLFIISMYTIQFKNVFKFRLNAVDTIFGLYFCFNIVYLALSFSALKNDSGIAANFNGFRMQVMVIISYITARLISERKSGGELSFMRFLSFFGTFVAIVGIIEIFISPLPLLDSIGMKEYLIKIGGMFEKEFSKEGGVLTYFANFNTVNGESIRWRRSASLFLSPITFAQVFLVTVPISLVLLLNKKISKWHLIIQIIGLLSTISRGPIAAIMVSGFSILLLEKSGVSKKQKRYLIMLFTLLLGLIVYKGIDFINATLSLRDPSAISRATTYYNSFIFFQNNPMGAGLSASDSKFSGGNTMGGGESEYLENVSRIGVIGLLLYLALHFIVLQKSYSGLKNNVAQVAILSAIIFGITVGLFTQEFVNRIWKHPFLPFIYGWLVGTWVTYYYNETNKIYQ